MCEGVLARPLALIQITLNDSLLATPQESDFQTLIARVTLHT